MPQGFPASSPEKYPSFSLLHVQHHYWQLQGNLLIKQMPCFLISPSLLRGFTANQRKTEGSTPRVKRDSYGRTGSWHSASRAPVQHPSTNPIHPSLTRGLRLHARNPYLQLWAGSCSQITTTALIFLKLYKDWVLFISLLVYELFVGRGQKTSKGSRFEGFSLQHAGQEPLYSWQLYER